MLLPATLAPTVRTFLTPVITAAYIGLLSAAPAVAQETTPSPSGTWAVGQNLTSGRYAPGVVRLADGRVLVAGGYHNSPYETATAQLYDATGMTSVPTGSLQRARNFPVGVLVDENRDGLNETPLFFGGFNSYYGSLNTVERYDTSTGKFATLTYTASKRVYTSAMLSPRELFTATKLPNGRVLLVAGLRTGYGTLRSAELYDPVTRRFTATGSLTGTHSPYGRFGHDAVLLPGGKYVLVVGGKAWIQGQHWPALNTAELYNVATGQFTAVPFTMKYYRDRVTLAHVGGRILIVAGTQDLASGRLDPLETEWFDPAKLVEVNGTPTFTGNPFSGGPSLQQGRMAHTLTPLSGGGFLVAGGWSESRLEIINGQVVTGRGTTATAERFVPDATDPLGGRFVGVPSSQFDALDQAAVALTNGSVLVVGGKQVTGGAAAAYPRRAEVFTPTQPMSSAQVR